LTPNGEAVLGHARRMLAINDQIMNLAGATAAERAIRLGLSGDFVGAGLWRTLAAFRRLRPEARFQVKTGASEQLVNEIGEGGLDVVFAMSIVDPVRHARLHWSDEMVWARAPQMRIEPGAPVPLVSRGETCPMRRHAIAARERAGAAHHVVFAGGGLASLVAAVGAAVGVMALPRRLLEADDLVIWDDGPPLPDVICNMCLRRDADEHMERLAQALADA